MNLVIGSCFRNSAGPHIDRYAERLRALAHACLARGITLHVVASWGDSTDATEQALWDALRQTPLHEIIVVERTYGHAEYGSSEHPERLAGFAYAANGVFEAVGAGADYVVYVESDLVWTPETLLAPLPELRAGREVIAIPTFCGPTDCFYDTWGFRTPDGRRFGALPPYWDELNLHGLTEVSTAGGCLVMRGDVARECRCSKEEALVGFCHDARGRGYHVWADWRLRVEHP